MCGIAGFYGFKNDDLIHTFSREMQHRGPDGDGFYIDADVSMMSRRLAIIDRKGGDQPIYNEDGTVAVVYNGEIYNYRELRKELEAAGHTFKTASDTEVIVHGYEEWGISAFDRLNGMFGAALYDIKNKKLMVARDHFGIKPIHFIRPEGTNHVVFSSEIKPLINSGLIEKKPNDKTIYRYLRFRIHDEGRETFFAGVERLLPGEVMTITEQGMEISRYSTLEETIEKAMNITAAVDYPEFRTRLIEAIRMRLVAEVPVGSCLSGGLDSSTVVAVIQRLLNEHDREAQAVGKTQNVFSAVFPGSTNDEERYIDDLLKKAPGITSYKVRPTPEQFFAEIDDFVKTQEEPTISTGPYAQYKVMEEVAKHVTVVLDGQGADEMMAGYLPYYFVYLRQLRREGRYGALLKEAISSRDVLMKYAVLKFTRRRGVDPSSLLNRSFASTYHGERFVVENHNLKKRLKEDIFKNSLQSLLRYEDRNSMRFSVEGRVPFLDKNLVAYLFGLSDEAIIRSGWNKHVLRESMKDYLPESIYRRRNKIGFTTPEHEWFIRMKNRIYAYFMSEKFASRPYFNQTAVVSAFREFIEGKNDDTLVFWRLLNLELWLRIFFDPPEEQKKPRAPYAPNTGKHTQITVSGKTYERYPVRTELYAKGDDYAVKTADAVKGVFEKKQISGKKWIAVVSEKVVAISQGRSYFIWDINPGFFARHLSRFVTRTPYGIGLGSPWTMQLAITEVGLPRILLASFVSILTKPLGMKGMFYRVAGREAAAIDGPTEYSLYPSNVSAKLPPKDPDSAAGKIRDAVNLLPKEITAGFLGAAIIDANDLGRTVLGNATSLKPSLIEDIFADNPMGQADEQTPVTIVVIP